MDEILHKIIKFVDHQRGTFIGITVASLIWFAATGCESLVKFKGSGIGLQDEEVSRVELHQNLEVFKAAVDRRQGELEAFIAQGEATFGVALAALDRQDELKSKIFDVVGGLVTTAASGGTVDAVGALSSLVNLGILGAAGGLIVDKKRANKVISELKSRPTA